MSAPLYLNRTVPMPWPTLLGASVSVVATTELHELVLRLEMQPSAYSYAGRFTLAREIIGEGHPLIEALKVDPENTLRLWAAEKLLEVSRAWERAGGGR